MYENIRSTKVKGYLQYTSKYYAKTGYLGGKLTRKYNKI